METSGFFISQAVQGVQDRAYTAMQFCDYFSHFISNGVFPNPSTRLQVVSRGGWEIAVLEGFAWINGFWYKEDGEKTLTIDFADDFLDRIDAVVVRWNNNERVITAEIKKGVPSANAQRPAIQKDDNIYELCLAYISVRRGATQITQANITDVRLDSTVCGIVHGLVDQVDTSQLFAQLESYIENYKKSTSADFLMWFETVKDILDENVAAHLLGMMEEADARLTEQIAKVDTRLNERIDATASRWAQFVSSSSDFKIFDTI